MAASNQAIARKLNRLYRLCKAGERGFLVVSENASNRGLKVILKSYAQQRATFANELKEEIQRLGGQVSERRSILGLQFKGAGAALDQCYLSSDQRIAASVQEVL